MANGPLTEKEQFVVRKLLGQMTELASTMPAKKRIVRCTQHEFEGHGIKSWKCTEWLYKKDPCPLPTRARGLFTSADGVVVARGYDKFFNVGEVKQARWDWIEAHTVGPYELTVKENGCLILAAALDEGRALLVTSKHAVNVPHAQVGRQWVERHLAQAGRTVEELAAFLHANSATAVFELCDDAFEEHILEYPERTRGLYLHGINRNVADLDTWPSTRVSEVAREFGFHVTKHFEFETAQDGRAFADQVRNDHVLDGRAIEGFVVRCQIADSERPFMFKIKYDEPYLMFREWREVTNRIMKDGPYRITYPLTRQYVAWLKRQLQSSSTAADFSEFGQQKGIIAARKRFLEYYKTHGGSEGEVYQQMDAGILKVLLVPVASIGCGKTTVSLALSELFGFGHVQNDNITAKKNARGAFHNDILKQFDDHDMVIADRNNHLPVLRESLTSTIRSHLVNCRIVALYWSHENASQNEILKLNSARVLGRGERHQSLTPKRTPDFRGIMAQFVRQLAPLDLESPSDSLIEEVIELDPMADSKENLDKAIDGLCTLFPNVLTRPPADKVARALDSALAYKPTAQKNVVGTKKTKPAFFGLVPVGSEVEDWQTRLPHTSPSDRSAEWDVCREVAEAGTHKRALHITLAHIASAKKEPDRAIYNAYLELHKKAGKLEAECHADYVVCNGESLVALRVRSITMASGQSKPVNDAALRTKRSGSQAAQLATVNEIPHITLSVGADTGARQANDMLLTVFGAENAAAPKHCPEGWVVIPVSLKFSARFESFMT